MSNNHLLGDGDDYGRVGGGIDTIQMIGFDLIAFDLSEMGESVDGRSFINVSATDSIYTGTFAELLDSIELL